MRRFPTPSSWPTRVGGGPARENRELELGLNIVQGKVVYKPVADAWGLDYEPLTL